MDLPKPLTEFNTSFSSYFLFLFVRRLYGRWSFTLFILLAFLFQLHTTFSCTYLKMKLVSDFEFQLKKKSVCFKFFILRRLVFDWNELRLTQINIFFYLLHILKIFLAPLLSYILCHMLYMWRSRVINYFLLQHDD